jgi:hypothetical protein
VGAARILTELVVMLPSVIGGQRDVLASFALAASDNVCHVIIDSARQFRIAVLGSF